MPAILMLPPLKKKQTLIQLHNLKNFINFKHYEYTFALLIISDSHLIILRRL